MDEEDAERYDKIYKQKGQEFCEIFSADKIGTAEVSDFLDWFVIRKVRASRSELQIFGRVMKQLVKWLVRGIRDLQPNWLLFPFARCFDDGSYDQARWDKEESFHFTAFGTMNPYHVM